MPKPEMIRAVLRDNPDLPAPQVQTTVYERYGGAVTTREVAQVRKKLRQPDATPEPAPAAPRTTRAKKPPAVAESPAPAEEETPAEEPAPRKRSEAKKPRATDYARADVTVKQLSAILAVAEEVGGLKRLREAVRTVALLRGKVGDVDERQLAYALDFLADVTGRK
jgi:hypothetical protein